MVKMAMIQFVRNQQDLSTDKGFQFKFMCDKCGNGYMSRFQPNALGIAGSVLNAAGSIFGWGYSAGHGAYEIQRAIGGPQHDAALRTAVEEGRQHFHQCTRCGRWVCPEVCWNDRANLCEECAPKMEEEMPALQAQVKVQAAQQQLYEKATKADYASAVDMSAGAQAQAPAVAQPEPPKCRQCGFGIAGAKFCPQCGTPAITASPTCKKCSYEAEPGAKFCPQCGTRF